jgi:hypothetical protein
MPEPVDPRRQMPSRKCDLCAEPMKHIGNEPSTSKVAEIRLFRCYECCLITTETFDPVAGAWTCYGFPGKERSSQLS